MPAVGAVCAPPAPLPTGVPAHPPPDATQKYVYDVAPVTEFQVTSNDVEDPVVGLTVGADGAEGAPLQVVAWVATVEHVVPHVLIALT